MARKVEVQTALRRAIEYAATHLDPKLELVATREADIRDFPMNLHLGQVGHRRHPGAGLGLGG
ncbi:hypothetical protein [Jannaschia formosa]|uniref:hypothetical protein n=1 Tax=Jannaschia formosa TaxID=2259592 RepID=UPI001075117E|nr:hypothetical protein [Jannaschia formosa]TFL19851.1 hypothetical protein DR046_00445 [Jannaschia formosa]